MERIWIQNRMIVITVLIMACIFCVIGLREISKLTKENKDLQKALEAEQQLRESEADRYELIIEAKTSRIKEEVEKRQEAEIMARSVVDREIKSKQLINPMGEHTHISYKQAIRRREFINNPIALQGEEIAVKAMLVETVSREVSKHIKECNDAMHCETIYSLDIWV